MKRKALLIGVPEYEAVEALDLPVVHDDVDLLRNVLEASNYRVESLGVRGMPPVSRNRLIKEVGRFCRGAAPGETLFLYFSGHGYHFDGQDFLVPHDAVFDQPSRLGTFLVPLDFARDFDDSKAETILFFVDACREGIELVGDDKAVRLGRWGDAKLSASRHREAAYVLSCAAGDLSRFSPFGGGYSYFTRALATVLSPSRPESSFRDVIDAAQAELNALTSADRVPWQEIRVRAELGANPSLDDRVICGSTAPPQGRVTTRSWKLAVRDSLLWQLSKDAEGTAATALRDVATAIVSEFSKCSDDVAREIPTSAWRDEALPIRTLSRLEFLVKECSPELGLSAAEAALLAVAPFVHHAFRMTALHTAIGAGGLALDPGGRSTGVGGSLERFFRATPGLRERAVRLRPDDPAASESIAMWLLNKWFVREPEVWNPPPEGFLHDKIWSVLSTQRRYDTLGKVFDGHRMLELARCLSADLERVERKASLKDEVVVGAGTGVEQTIREKALGFLLALAARLALDPASLAEVMVEHIGTGDPFDPAAALRTIDDSEWIPVGQSRSLRSVCDHPVMDHALRVHVAESDEYLQRLHQRASGTDVRLRALAQLPARLTADHVVAATRNGEPAYQRPHLRFELAQREVRELLMGEKIYGDAALAIRELYQNALDACRYREARLAFLRQTMPGLHHDWQGEIIFEQGRDRAGRAYIECRDNGIGMGESELVQCFARAGKRFCEMPEFLEEQANWLHCERPIHLYPNSQFGIGVFSYFMLADEIEVRTCRLGLDGSPGTGLLVSISSGASLFRMRPLPGPAQAGTAVRLYLKRKWIDEKSVSAMATLRELLWVAEFKTTAIEDGERFDWPAGELQLSPSKFRDVKATPGEDSAIWWLSSEKGALLADGIYTATDLPFAVVDLRHAHRPELTVDRKQIVRHDNHYVQAILSRNVDVLASGVKWLDYNWLWSFGETYPELGDRLAARLGAQSAELSINHRADEHDTAGRTRLKVAVAGCFPADKTVAVCALVRKRQHMNLPPLLTGLRCATLRDAGLEVGAQAPAGAERPNLPASPSGAEWERKLKVVFHKPASGGWYERLPVDALLRSASRFEQSPAQLLKEVRRWSGVAGIDVSDLAALQLPDDPMTSRDRLLFNRRSRRPALWMILKLAIDTRQPLASVYRRVSRLAPFLKIDVPDIRVDSLPELPPQQADIVMLSADLDGRAPLLAGDVSVAHVLAASARLRMRPADIAARLERYTALIGGHVPTVDWESAAPSQTDAMDPVLLSRRLDGRPPWVEGQVSAGHVLRASAKRGRPVAEIMGRLQEYAAALGLRLPALKDSDWPSASPGPVDQLILSKSLSLDEPRPWIAGRISVGHIIGAASKLSGSRLLEYVFDRLKLYAPIIGLQLPVESFESLPADIVPKRDAVLLSVNLNGRDPWISGRIDARHLLLSAFACRLTAAGAYARLQAFAPLMGLDLDAAGAAVDGDGLTSQESDILTREVDGKHQWRTKVSTPDIVESAAATGTSVRDVYSRVHARSALVGMQLPYVNTTWLWPEPPDETDQIILSEHHTTGPPFRRRFGGAEILAAAIHLGVAPSAVAERVLRYRPMIEVDDVLLQPRALPSSPVDRLDRELLSGHPGPGLLSGEVRAGYLVDASFRLHRTVAFILERLQLYSAMLKLALPASEKVPPTLTADELDCILCSKDLDGKAPWVQRTVTADHLRAAAWITREPESVLAQRIRALACLGLLLEQDLHIESVEERN